MELAWTLDSTGTTITWTSGEGVSEKVRRVLTPDLLKSQYRAAWTPDNPFYGHCYHAAEALWHLLGGPACAYKPVRARDDSGVVHWWLEWVGIRLDPTADQYWNVGKEPPYSRGRFGGFLTKAPSKRAAEIIRRVELLVDLA